jgi:formamidopyrimidine-DNA glycosylase
MISTAMPELPEVESVARALRDASLIGKKIVSIKVFCSKMPQSLVGSLLGRHLINISRRGKYLHFLFDPNMSLIVHLRMTGQFKHERVNFAFCDGPLIAFYDTRRFGTFDLTLDPDRFFSKLGPEPFDPCFNGEELLQRLSNHNRAVKSSLLDQYVVAGIGNIYADEALWIAKIHPMRPSCSLTREECERLYQAIYRVLEKGIENGGTSLGDATSNFHHLNGKRGQNQSLLSAYGQETKPCPRCFKPIEKIIVCQRGTHFCPACQKLLIDSRSIETSFAISS